MKPENLKKDGDIQIIRKILPLLIKSLSQGVLIASC